MDHQNQGSLFISEEDIEKIVAIKLPTEFEAQRQGVNLEKYANGLRVLLRWKGLALAFETFRSEYAWELSEVAAWLNTTEEEAASLEGDEPPDMDLVEAAVELFGMQQYFERWKMEYPGLYEMFRDYFDIKNTPHANYRAKQAEWPNVDRIEFLPEGPFPPPNFPQP